MKIRQIATYLLWAYTILTVYVIFRSLIGLAPQPVLTPFLTLFAFTFALLHGSQRMGWKQILLLLGLTFVVSLIFESVGVATGWVYGKYHYTDRLGPKFLNLVPYLIPTAWFMMIYPSYVIAAKLVPPGWKMGLWQLSVAGLGGTIMTAWDLALDPMMVAGGHWVWDEAGSYFGVPLQNYWGWWLTTFLTFAIFLWAARISADGEGSHTNEMDWQAAVSYIVTGLSAILISFSIGLGASGLVGLFAMLPWLTFYGLKKIPAQPAPL